MSIMGLLSKANVKDDRTKQWMRGGEKAADPRGKTHNSPIPGGISGFPALPATHRAVSGLSV